MSESSASSTSSRSSEQTVDRHQPRATNEQSNSRVTFRKNVADTEKDASALNRKQNASGQGPRGKKLGELGGFARSTLAPLTPLTKPGQNENFASSNAKPSVGYAYSSPNLQSLNAAPAYDRARMMHYYLSGSGVPRGNTNYVDPLYRQLNPSVNGLKNKPVWSLNQPLPHVLNPSLAEKMIQKNMEARSRPSSKPGSRDMSRENSMTSASDWYRSLKGMASGRKQDDVEAQLNQGRASRASSKATFIPDLKPTQSQSEVARENQQRHPATFSLGADSYPPSVADRQNDAPKTQPPATQDAELLLKEQLRQDADNAGVLCDELDSDDAEPTTFPNFWAKIRYYFREPFAEFLGTLILVIFGVGGNLQATVTKGAGGSYESLSFAWGFGCMLGVYVAGGISGGHINPAVTISMAIFRKFPWKKVPIYLFAQIWGAFFGGAMAYGYFWSSITEYEGGAHIRTAASGACLFTNPKDYVTWRNAFFDEFIGASILVGCLMALLDDTNAPPASGMTAFIVGLLVAAIGMALGFQTSFTINPARDLGPRIFASMIGYGPHAFHLTHWWWTWGAWGGPIAGGIAGALVYDLLIFTGCESPVNYPDNGYIEHRVAKLLHHEKKHMEYEDGKDSNDHSSTTTKH
ncbi:LAMI_0E16292g1_1 [Lachancea mirantina]|uniref:LAMI_0E16292g1_1 n=1 Tax=Lachancea mirantina TaxID=1230905 RepID=A0A1G4JTC7_9SACH|nr:LAMI_0E16292g1_1 [Lachancea mirantina]